MKGKVVWLILGCLMALSLVLASCAPAVVEEKEEKVVTEEKAKRGRHMTLDRAVEKGRITQEKADEIKAWYEQKPEVLGSGRFQRARTFKAKRGRHMWGGHRRCHFDNTT